MPGTKLTVVPSASYNCTSFTCEKSLSYHTGAETFSLKTYFLIKYCRSGSVGDWSQYKLNVTITELLRHGPVRSGGNKEGNIKTRNTFSICRSFELIGPCLDTSLTDNQ